MVQLSVYYKSTETELHLFIDYFFTQSFHGKKKMLVTILEDSPKTVIGEKAEQERHYM